MPRSISVDPKETGRVPVVDVARRLRAIEPELVAASSRVIASGRLLLGEETSAFEAEFAAFAGRRFAVAVASGTEALRLTLAALGVGPGDEVIVPALTAVPTVAAVCSAGAVPVPVDVDPETATMDFAAAEAAVTTATRAAIVVHLYGRPAPLPDLGVPVVEDAAHAHGALDGQPAGAAAAYSFYPTKNLGGIGDGGAVVTDDPGLDERIRSLRAHGARPGYVHVAIAGNSRMSEIEAAALRIGLRDLRERNDRRRAVAAAYRRAAPDLGWQADHDDHVFHLCVARPGDRDRWRAEASFQTALHYPLAITQQPAYRRFVRNPCPEAERWAAECVTLPCFPELTDEEMRGVCQALV